MEPTTTAVLGRREYPCSKDHRTTYTKKPTAVGVYSRRCPQCGAYWVLHVEPSVLADRMPGLLKMRWATS